MTAHTHVVVNQRRVRRVIGVIYVGIMLSIFWLATLIADNFYAVLAAGFIAGVVGERLRRGVAVEENAK